MLAMSILALFGMIIDGLITIMIMILEINEKDILFIRIDNGCG